MTIDRDALIQAAYVGFALSTNASNGDGWTGMPELDEKRLLLILGVMDDYIGFGLDAEVEAALTLAGMLDNGEVTPPERWRSIDAEGYEHGAPRS